MTVESTREDILEPGFKTFVRPGEAPTMPVRLDAELNRERILKIQKKTGPEVDVNGIPSFERLAHDNDRRNGTSDPQRTNSRTNDNPQRASPTLSLLSSCCGGGRTLGTVYAS